MKVTQQDTLINTDFELPNGRYIQFQVIELTRVTGERSYYQSVEEYVNKQPVYRQGRKCLTEEAAEKVHKQAVNDFLSTLKDRLPYE